VLEVDQLVVLEEQEHLHHIQELQQHTLAVAAVVFTVQAQVGLV
jgi:hypothetical protein